MAVTAARRTLDIVWSKRRARELFNARVLPALLPGRTVEAAAREHQHFRADGRCITLYALTLEGATEPLLASVLVGDDGFRAWVLERHHDGDAVLHLPELSCIVALYPADAVLPSLRHAVDPAAAGARLSDTLDCPVDVTGIDVLRYRPHARAVLRYRLRGSDTPAEVIAKLYPSRQQMERTAERLRALAGEASEPLVLPELLGTHPEWHALFMQSVLGEKLGRALKAAGSADEAAALIDTVAAGMAAFHALPVPDEQPLSIAGELDKVREQQAGVADVAPQLAGRVDALVARMAPLAAEAHAPALGPVHGEFLLDGSRLAVVDLDRTRAGDPAIDAGKLMARLDKMALLGGRAHLRGLGDRFTQSYEAQRAAAALGARADLYRAIVLMRMALERFHRSPRRWRSLRCLELLDASEALLGA